MLMISTVYMVAIFTMLHRVQSFFLMTKGVDTGAIVCIVAHTISTVNGIVVTTQ